MIPNNPHALDLNDLLDRLGTEADTGLSSAEASERYELYGANALANVKRKSSWLILVGQLKSLLTALLAAAALLSFLYGDFIEGSAIAVVIIVNTAIGFFSELNAINSINALRKLGVTLSRVRRNARVDFVPAEELVPGDIIFLEAGDVVTADMRLIVSSQLECNESLLTGESEPVSKQCACLAPDTPLHERPNMVFKGSSVTRGNATAVVVATGMASQLGAIATLTHEAHDELTPLEKRLHRLSLQLVWIVLVIAIAVAAIGWMDGRDMVLMIKTGIALAVAAVPEGLPIVATLALARGMLRMAKRNALVERLSAVEGLGAVTVLFTDKTGTLTMNNMTASDLFIGENRFSLEGGGVPKFGVHSDAVQRVMRACSLCSSIELAKTGRTPAIGDPTEIALFDSVNQAGFSVNAFRSQYPRLKEDAFDPERRMMATYHRSDEGVLVAVKGAPESVLSHCTSVCGKDGATLLSKTAEKVIYDAIDAAALQGLRVLALADRMVSGEDEAPYQDLTFLGLVAMRDPPRPDVQKAIRAARKAGIKVIMLTGDNPVTGSAIAQAVGLTDTRENAILGTGIAPQETLTENQRENLLCARVFARVDPKQKLELISLHQAAGEIVAMTGDGVNDAPALKKADVGVAMGLRGTQVAKEAADIVLLDDAFATIVAAIREGRVIYSNIRKFVIYLLSCNLSEVLIVAIGIAFGMPLPLLPLQILFLNLVTDVFPALALGAGEGDSRVLERPPRDPKKEMLTKGHWVVIAVYGLIITASVLAAFLWALRQPEVSEGQARTIAFLTLAYAQLWHVFNMRGRISNPIINPVTCNPYVWGAISLCILLIMGAVYIPVFAVPLQLSPPGYVGWVVTLVASVVPLLLGQILKEVDRIVLGSVARQHNLLR
ncbi:MAG: cation-transporting P-type ATPase [Rhodospirillaceae bacterium]